MTLADFGLATELVELGLALGILRLREPPDADTVEPREQWFEDPRPFVSGIFAARDQREALLRLASRELGNPVPDLDLDDVPTSQQWIPIAATPTGGLFLVVEDAPAGQVERAVLGLGARVAGASEADGVGMAATVHVPLVRVGGSDAGFVTGTDYGTISVAATITLPAGSGGSGVELDGASVTARVPTADGAVPQFVMTLQGVRADGDPVGRDVTVSSDALSGELLDLTVTVLRALVADNAPNTPLAELLALLGLGGDGAVPVLRLHDVLTIGREPVRAWLRELTEDVATMRSWLRHLAGLLGLDPAAAVIGEGSAASPLAVVLDAESARVAITVIVDREATSGDVLVRPGLRVTMPAPAGVAGLAIASADLAEVRLGLVNTARVLPAAQAVVHLGPDLPLVPGAEPLAAATVRGLTVQVGALRAGVALDSAGRPVLILAALDVLVGADRYPVVDLTMPDAVLAAVEGALDGALAALLTTFEGSDVAVGLLALLGLRPPLGRTAADWDHSVSLPSMFTGPLEALRAFHAGVLAAGDWDVLLGELARLVGGGTPITIDGGGTVVDPWLVDVATDPAGTAALAAWADPTTSLHVALRLRPPARDLVDGTVVTTAIDVELCALDFEDGQAEPFPVVSISLEVGDGLSFDAGPLFVVLDRVDVHLRWRRRDGLGLRLTVEGAEAIVDGVSVTIPIPPFDSAESFPEFPDDFPWVVITRLLAQGLTASGEAWRAGLATLTGWDSGVPDLIDLPVGTPLADLPGLPIEQLPDAPLEVIRQWLALLLGDVASVAAPQIAGWLGAVISGADPEGGAFGADVGGGGSPADPYAVRLGTAANAADLLLWFEPAGTTLLGVPELILPGNLTRPLDLLEGDVPDAGELSRLLTLAAAAIPELAAIVGGRPTFGAGLAQLTARLTDTDGLVPLASQRAIGSPLGIVDGLTHLEAPLGFEPAVHLPSDTAPELVVYVSVDLPGLHPWSTQVDDTTVVDLTEPGLEPLAIDLSGVTAEGPWFFRLGTRAAVGGFEGQVGRLERAIAAVRQQIAVASTLTVVAHGPAALAALRIASTAANGIAHVVAVAAPLAGATFEFVDDPASGDALRALGALAALLSAEARRRRLRRGGSCAPGHAGQHRGRATLGHVPAPGLHTRLPP